MALRDNPIVFLSKKTWEFSKGNRKRVVLYSILFVIANLISFLEPLVIAKMFNVIQLSGITANNIYGLFGIIALLILLQFGFWVFHGPARIIERSNAFLVRANYRKYLINGVMSLPADWHTNHHSGDTIDRVNRAADKLYDYATESYQVIEVTIRLVSSYLALAFFNLHSSYIVLFTFIIVVSTIIRFDKSLSQQHLKLFRSENRVASKIFDIISNITTILVLSVQKVASKSISKKIMSPFRLHVRNAKLSETKWFIVSMLAITMTFLVLSTYIYSQVAAGKAILAGTVYALFGYVQRINGIFFRFASRYGRMVRQQVAIINVQPTVDKFRKKDIQNGTGLQGKWNSLDVKNLNFSYYHQKQKRKLHLHNINMIINRGERIALIGESGSGKTTFLKLMIGLYEPDTLDLYLNNKRLQSFNEIKSNVELIPQEPELFATTIKENITMGLDYSEADVKKFTDLANITKVIKKLPKKFDSSIVEKGVNLSGGEKQRLALARGLLFSAGKEIILLDEPTSSVDRKNEARIYKNIFKRFKDETIISSVHSLHLLPKFDIICLFKDGMIVASGSYSQIKRTKEFKQYVSKYKVQEKVHQHR